MMSAFGKVSSDLGASEMGAERTLYHRMAEGSGRRTADGIDDKELLGFEVEEFK
jgi:hypothetical protein